MRLPLFLCHGAAISERRAHLSDLYHDGTRRIDDDAFDRLSRKIRSGEKIENDMPLLFEHFKTKQFFTVFAMLLAYVVLINVLGFYVSSLLFIAGTLIFFKIKPLYIVITTVVFLVLIYGGFSTFLHVPLPRGLLI